MQPPEDPPKVVGQVLTASYKLCHTLPNSKEGDKEVSLVPVREADQKRGTATMGHLDNIRSAGFKVCMFQAEILIASLDDSGDLPRGQGMEGFDSLLIDKYMEMDPLLIEDLDRMGIENPILVEIDNGKWLMVDGHHRLAWASIWERPIPVVFVEWDTDMFELDAIMCEAEVDYDHR